MFKWLARQFSRNEDDFEPLGSERGLERFIAGLPVVVPARTIEALGEPFEKARFLDLPPARLRRALVRLDDRAQETLPALWEGLFEDAFGRQIADTAWLVLARFYRNLHAGYDVWLETLRAAPQAPQDERAAAVVIACRAMGALGRYKSLLRTRYRALEPAYWERLHGLAAWSEAFGGSTTLIEPYPGSGHQTSVEREYLTALVYDSAPIENLQPAQLVGLDLLLRRLATHFQFAGGYRDSAPFVTDPERDPGVRRSLKGLAPRASQRFFGVGGAYAQLARLHKESMREVPEWMMHARLDPAAYRNLLELLLQHWSQQPPQRRHRRRRVDDRELLVTRGVAQVRRMIAASEYAHTGRQLSYDENTPYDHKLFARIRFGSVERPGTGAAPQGSAAPAALETLQKLELEGDRQMTERWRLVDVSEGGFGAQAAAHGGWARTGMLIGFRQPDGLDWQLAVIRRLSRPGEGKLSIGVQTIEGEALCARLRFGDDDAGDPWVAVAGTNGVHQDAILVRADSGHLQLLLEPGAFGGVRECMLSFEQVWRRARLERSLERGYDFERVEVQLLPPQASA